MVAAGTTARNRGGFGVTTAAGVAAIDDDADAGSTAGRVPDVAGGVTTAGAGVIGAGAANVPTSTGPACMGTGPEFLTMSM